MTRRAWQALAAWAVVLSLVVFGVGVATRSRTASSYTVTIDAGRYQPPLSVLKVGDVITWINLDLVPHTATSRTGTFDSGAIDPGRSWTHKATRAGDFRYACVFHPTMTALLRVR